MYNHGLKYNRNTEEMNDLTTDDCFYLISDFMNSLEDIELPDEVKNKMFVAELCLLELKSYIAEQNEN